MTVNSSKAETSASTEHDGCGSASAAAARRVRKKRKAPVGEDSHPQPRGVSLIDAFLPIIEWLAGAAAEGSKGNLGPLMVARKGDARLRLVGLHLELISIVKWRYELCGVREAQKANLQKEGCRLALEAQLKRAKQIAFDERSAWRIVEMMQKQKSE